MKRRELLRRNVWFVLRHAPRDRRLRGVALRFGLIGAYVAGWATYEVHALHEVGVWGAVWAGMLGALGIGCAWWIRRNHAKEDEGLLRLSVHSARPAASSEGHRLWIVAELLRTAVLCDRSGVEALHQQGKIVEEHWGIARRRTLDLARQEGVWDGLSAAERDLLMSAEGEWPPDEIGRYLGRAEDVRVLRWVLGIDEVLPPFEFLQEDLGPVVRTTTRPGELDGTICLDSYDLRPERDLAQTMMVRCLAEGVRRGFFQAPDEESRRALVEGAEELAASPSDDLYAGEVRVADASDDAVKRTARAALRRVRVLTGVIEYLNGPAEVALRLNEGTEA